MVLALFCQLPVPVKLAVIEWLPWVSVLVDMAAWPVPSTVTVDSVVAPSLNATEPVGVPPPPVAVTVAVKVTDWPTTLGFRLELTEVDVGPFTTWLEPEPLLFPH